MLNNINVTLHLAEYERRVRTHQLEQKRLRAAYQPSTGVMHTSRSMNRTRWTDIIQGLSRLLIQHGGTRRQAAIES